MNKALGSVLGSAVILHGDCLEMLRLLPDKSIQCVVTSPPYFKARIYDCEPTLWGDGWIGVLGDEDDLESYIAHLVEIFEEIRRVLRDDGVCWLNIGDQYGQKGKRATKEELAKDKIRAAEKGYATGAFSGSRGWDRAVGTAVGDIKEGDLTLAPEHIAIELQKAGWFIRARVLWVKVNGLSQSAKDRPSPNHEHIWMITKSRKYFYNREAVRYSAAAEKPEDYEAYLKTVWDIPTQANASPHSSSYPDELVRRAILLSTPECSCADCGAPYQPVVIEGEQNTEAAKRCGGNKDGGYEGKDLKNYEGQKAQNPGKTKSRILKSLVKREVCGWLPSCNCVGEKSVPAKVLDPFMGSGTTAYVGVSEGRDVTGIELGDMFFEISEIVSAMAMAGMNRLEINRVLKEMYPA